jgi:sugar lactone lactonase YvrE
MKRRSFLGIGALVPAALLARRAEAQRAGCNVAVPAAIPIRSSGPVEVAYKAPHGQPNGLAQGPETGQLWVQDRGTGRQVTLIRAADGNVIREIQAEVIGPSGIALDDDGTMWTSDTHGVMLVNFAAADGKTLGKYFVPGACRMYVKAGDAPQRGSPLKRAYPDESRAMGDSLPHNEGNDTGSGLGPGRVDPKTDHFWSATGSAGIIVKGDLLLYSNLSARAIFSVHKKTWMVQDVWPTPGNRPLGLCWADAARTSFWSADANLQTLYRYDLATGAIREGIQLPEGSPVLHGCQLVGDQMYFTDDTGWICRFRM